MEIDVTKLTERELEQVNEMYKHHLEEYDYEGDCLEFVNDFLAKCTYCGDIVYYDDLINFEEHKVCEECHDELQWELDHSEYEPDPYDEYIDRKLEEGEL